MKLPFRDWNLRNCVAIVSAALLLVVGVTVSGCASRVERGTTITLSTWGSAEELSQLRTVLVRFEAAHPGVHVSLVHIPENYFQKLHILVAGGLTPDVMAVNSLSFPMYADNDILAPVDDLLDTASDAELGATQFFPQSLAAFRWRKHLYALPRDVSDLVVFYNADLFKQLGVAVPTATWTTADLRRIGARFTADLNHDGTRDRFGFSFGGKPPLVWSPWVWSAGGDVFDPALKTSRLSEPVATAALQRYADLRNRDHIAPTKLEAGSTTMSQLFLQGKLAMFVSGRWSVPVLRQQAKFSWDVLPFPHGAAGSIVGIDASGYALARHAKHPAICRELIRYLSSRHAQTVFAQGGLIVPARRDVAESPAFLTGPPAHARVFLDAIETGYPTRVPPRWNEIAETLTLALEPVWDGTQPADQAMKAVAPRIRALLQ